MRRGAAFLNAATKSQLMRLTFNGAAGIVTGSSYLLEAAGKRILVDCGMFQGGKDVVRMNYEPFAYDPRSVDIMLLTHAHVDHSGLIPKLVRDGFAGKIYATKPTIDLAKIMLEDCAEVNAEDTAQENKRRMRAGQEPRDPLYTIDDVKKAMKRFTPADYDSDCSLSEGVGARFRNAGHILGSASILLTATEEGKTTSVLFSGDLGQGGTPIVDDPEPAPQADYVLVESTYGNRAHEDPSAREAALDKVVREAYARGGKLLIPSFSVERTQEVLYYLHRLAAAKKLPKESVFLDSPLSIKATEVFQKDIGYFRQSLRDEFKEPFAFKGLEFLKTTQDSMTMNDYRKPCIIIAGNGMCTAGRIRHHLKHNLWKRETTLLFVGYQAEGSLGRFIEEGAQIVKMMGIEVAVRAHVEKIDSFSSHADEDGLVQWLGGMKEKPKKVFIIHGEEESSEALAGKLGGLGFQTHVPKIGESVELP